MNSAMSVRITSTGNLSTNITVKRRSQMPNGTLERINDDLETAKKYVKKAGSRASGAGDTAGSDKCDREAERIDDLKEDFSQKGR
jgi:hypothetical protein